MQPTTTKGITLGIAIVLGAMLGATATVAAQPQLAYAATPHNDFVVFFDKDVNALSPSAAKTVGMAARDMGTGRIVRLSGNPGRTAAVKDELVRQGVPAAQIEERRNAGARLPTAGDAISNPIERRVEISF